MQENTNAKTSCQNNDISLNFSKENDVNVSSIKRKIGFVTTWNQPCGLASYARMLLNELKNEDIVIFAEDTITAKREDDEENVIRCWKQQAEDYSDLYRAIKEQKIDILYLYCHYDFFSNSNFLELIYNLKLTTNLKVITHLHNTFTNNVFLIKLLSISNKVFVHSKENRLQVIANGAKPQDVLVVPLGLKKIPKISDEERMKIRNEFGLQDDEKLLLTFGFIQPHKKMDILINAVKEALVSGFRVKGAIVGSTRDDDKNSKRYLNDLKTMISDLYLQDYIHIYDDYVSDEKLNAIIQCAEIVFLNYRCNYYESSGTGNLALMNGAVLVTSLAPCFEEYQDAVWHLTGGFPAPISTKILLSNPHLKDEILKNAQKYIETHSFYNASKIIRSIFNELSIKNLLERRYV